MVCRQQRGRLFVLGIHTSVSDLTLYSLRSLIISASLLNTLADQGWEASDTVLYSAYLST